MPSSISNSRHPAFTYAKILFAICASLTISFELLSDDLLKHHSETYARVSQQYADALRLRHAKPREPMSVLMVGNSLLLYGVDVDRLQKLTSSQLSIHPIFLEATGYYDWLYALRRLFRDGSRPQVVVLGVGVNAFLSNAVRQDYAPLMLFDLQDAYDVASELKFDRTATSNLLLDHSSAFWDTRSVFRMQVLRHIVPHCQQLFLLLKPQPPSRRLRNFTPLPIPVCSGYDVCALPTERNSSSLSRQLLLRKMPSGE